MVVNNTIIMRECESGCVLTDVKEDLGLLFRLLMPTTT